MCKQPSVYQLIVVFPQLTMASDTSVIPAPRRPRQFKVREASIMGEVKAADVKPNDPSLVPEISPIREPKPSISSLHTYNKQKHKGECKSEMAVQVCNPNEHLGG